MSRRLTRSREKVIAGVCGGIAEYLDLDPTLVRIAYLVLSVAGFGSGLLVYLVLWFIMPQS
ncbi:MAG: PspC domain-containing protein [Cytophagales bacterium]|nr:PspC domain-containing protein [Cytophagales bacterium]